MNTPIKTEADYEKAMLALKNLMLANPDEGTEDSDQLARLAHLIAAYEDRVINCTALP